MFSAYYLEASSCHSIKPRRDLSMTMIRKFFVLSAVAAAVSLTACGGSDDPVQTATDIPAVSVSPANAATAKAAATALASAPAVTLPALTSKEGTAIPAGSTLKFLAAAAGTPATSLAGFELTSGGSTAKGTLSAGSCIFTVEVAGAGLPVGTKLTFDPCTIDFNTAGVPTNGTTTNVAVNLSFGGVSVAASGVPVTVTVVNGQAVVSAGGATVGTGSVATGS